MSLDLAQFQRGYDDVPSLWGDPSWGLSPTEYSAGGTATMDRSKNKNKKALPAFRLLRMGPRLLLPRQENEPGQESRPISGTRAIPNMDVNVGFIAGRNGELRCEINYPRCTMIQVSSCEW